MNFMFCRRSVHLTGGPSGGVSGSRESTSVKVRSVSLSQANLPSDCHFVLDHFQLRLI